MNSLLSLISTSKSTTYGMRPLSTELGCLRDFLLDVLKSHGLTRSSLLRTVRQHWTFDVSFLPLDNPLFLFGILSNKLSSVVSDFFEILDFDFEAMSLDCIKCYGAVKKISVFDLMI